MGLLIRYVLEREYDIELDFCDSIPMRFGGCDEDFCFTDLELLKKRKEREDNNGTIRCSIESRLHICSEGGFFTQACWTPIYGMMTNLGMIICDPNLTDEAIPRIFSVHRLEVKDIKGSYKGRNNVFKLKFLNNKAKEIEKYFSVDKLELYPVWLNKIRQSIREYKELGTQILIPPIDR